MPTGALTRWARPEDIPAIRVVDKQSYPSSWIGSKFHRIMSRETNFSTVLTQNNRIISFLVGSNRGTHIRILRAATGAAYRRNGYMRLLFTKMVQSPRLCDHDAVTVTLRESNLEGLVACKKLGFKAVGLVREEFENPDEDGILMTWERDGKTT